MRVSLPSFCLNVLSLADLPPLEPLAVPSDSPTLMEVHPHVAVLFCDLQGGWTPTANCHFLKMAALHLTFCFFPAQGTRP